MSPGAKIKFARTSRRIRLSQYELERLTGIRRSTLNAWESSRNRPPMEGLKRVAEALEIPVSWFLDGEDTPIPGPVSTAPGVGPGSPRAAYEGAFRRKFPVLGSVGAAAIPLHSETADPDAYVEFSDDLYIRGREDQFAVQVWGDSMEPRLLHGDYVLVVPDPGYRVSGRCVVTADPEGRYLVKVLARDEKGWALDPINPAYERIRTDEPGWKLIGYIVGLRREKGRGRYLEEGDRTGLDAFG